MARATSNFRQQDVTRALRACVAAGVKAQRAEIDPVSGKIVIVLSDGAETPAPESAEVSALDAWRASRGAR
jgi:hypothetical protein